MGKIFCLMGKSSSGKDTIFKELLKDSSLKLNGVVLYTTRPKRINEEDGIDYNFINKEELDNYIRNNKIIEVRKYITVNGEWFYATIDDGQIDLNNGNYLIIVTLEAYEKYIEYFGIDNIVPLYIDLDDDIRLERALKRESEQENPNYKEVERRFVADNKDFSLENLNKFNITKKYENLDFNICINSIKEDILKSK